MEKNLQENVSISALSLILPISQPRETLQEEWIDLADTWQREKASQ